MLHFYQLLPTAFNNLQCTEQYSNTIQYNMKEDPPVQSTEPCRDPPQSLAPLRRPRQQVNGALGKIIIDPPPAHLSNDIVPPSNTTYSTMHQHQTSCYQTPIYTENVNQQPYLNNGGSCCIANADYSYDIHNNTSISRGRDRVTTLRRRSSTTSPYNYQKSNSYRQRDQYMIDITNNRDDVTDDTSQRPRNHNYREKLKPKKKSKSKHQAPPSRQIASLAIACMLMICGIGISFKVAMGAINFIFFTKNEDSTSTYLRGSLDTKEGTIRDKNSLKAKQRQPVKIGDDYIQSERLTNVEERQPVKVEDDEKRFKSEEIQITNEKPLENKDGNRYKEIDRNQDSTSDAFFFAGTIDTKTRFMNEKGRMAMVDTPGHTYANIPHVLDSNPFAISIWIHLSPQSENKKDEGRSRVILSTKSKGYLGCDSEIFGNREGTGIVLYAHPNLEDESDKTYRIMLEYAVTRNRSCQTLSSELLVREGAWHHVVIFATQTSRNERISMYVNGNLAARNENASRDFISHAHPESKTVVGRFAGGSSNHFDLDGRVSMLSFWETGGAETLTEIALRTKVTSVDDEDHVVKATNRAALDKRAIQRISNQGLAVREPSLLYTFENDIENSRDGMHHESQTTLHELMSGKDGKIEIELSDGMPVNQRQAFIPLGGNRYSEYKDGTYVAPKLGATERRELEEVARARASMVKDAMKHAWKGYRKYAFGKDELLPLSNGGQDNWGGMGTTLVDSLSTLWIMGMEAEFREAKDWVRDNLDFGQVRGGVSVFETTIRNLGGLLSAYDLSGDKVFLRKADDLGMRLQKAFKSRSGIPYGEVELFDGGGAYNTGWHSNYAVLSEIGTLQLEFRYLARATGKSEYATDVMRALDELLKLNAESGLYPTFISNNKETTTFGNQDISIGAMGDSFYEYLLKIWLQGGKKETKYRRRYDESVNGIIDKLIHMSRPNYLTYVAEMKRDKVIHKMDHLSCFLGGMLALGAYTHPDGLQSQQAQRQLKTGKQLAYTCYQMYARSKSGLSPEFVTFDGTNDDFKKGRSRFYILRPETVETFYILYQLTKDPVYREWSWEIFQAIEEHCKTDAGYAAIHDVDTMKQDNRMESFFLAETLKYLFLIFDDTNDIDLLNTHVFNTEAHPLKTW